jgi:hypothetical protein
MTAAFPVIKEMWPSLLCELLYTGMLIDPSSERSASNRHDAQRLTFFSRIKPSTVSQANGSQFLNRIVASKIETSTPEELGDLIELAIGKIGLENIIAYCPEGCGHAADMKSTLEDSSNTGLESSQSRAASNAVLSEHETIETPVLHSDAAPAISNDRSSSPMIVGVGDERDPPTVQNQLPSKAQDLTQLSGSSNASEAIAPTRSDGFQMSSAAPKPHKDVTTSAHVELSRIPEHPLATDQRQEGQMPEATDLSNGAVDAAHDQTLAEKRSRYSKYAKF